MKTTLVHNEVADAISDGQSASSARSVITDRANARVKRRIADNFSRAADSYDQVAILQKRVADRTMLGLPAELRSDIRTNQPGSTGSQASYRILDLGTGTGLHAMTLAERYDDAVVIGMDLAMGMLHFARHHSQHPRVDWCSGDIESIPLKSGAVDLIYSNLAIQWCSFAKVLCEVSRVLQPGGTFVFSTLAEGSLKELDNAWCLAGEKDRVNRFDNFVTQKQCLNDSDLVRQAFSIKAETLFYPDLITLLHSLKSLGVNTVLADKGGLLTRRKLETLQQAYEKIRQPEGLPLTYQVIYGVLQKPH
ncbi:malonyl-ACP O-methyltransferase BioC [Endozoicomonas sp. SCSIO W0465]|uniref:malonyl-ACP O-methyltransferase BioC n=1 Tax=Endozoicomonas sp. SCSIO W0465 TaxID=2918516 RepID=UPI00207509F5|nr:malonyl-ACP O-methyltransferase BioC [Endozoicomonas sp. SCSIO W0465]USE36979.1 malonyl-ACP O-methyltransferase BioC [Endozoicomonas sp. SCSIO W0465]